MTAPDPPGTPPVGPEDGSGPVPPVRGVTLRRRLTVLFAVGTLVVVAVATVAAVGLVNLIQARQTLITEVDPASLASAKLLEAYLDEETGIRGYVLTRNPAFAAPYLSGSSDQRQASAQLRADLHDFPELAGLAARAQQAGQSWFTSFAVPTILSTRAGDPLAAQQALLGPGKASFDEVRRRFATLDAALAAERDRAGASLTRATEELIAALAVGLLVLVAAGIGLRWALSSWVVGPLADLNTDVRKVADGDLSVAVTPQGPPEIAQLGVDVEAMRLRIVTELREVAAARSDLADRNLDLQRSNQELEQFAYVASHDLQEPLRKVTSFVQLLQQRYGGQLDDRADDYIDFAVDGARRMQQLIEDLLTFSGVGRTTAAFADVDLAAAAGAAVSALSATIADVGATVAVGPLPTVRGDPVLLTSLWQNLIANGLKFQGDRAPVISIDSVDLGDRWQCSVTDNGIGIEPRHADRVFVIFQRLHQRDAYPGTGIGLALCRKIVEFHGGTIWVDTAYTEGARLHFTIPAIDPRGTT